VRQNSPPPPTTSKPSASPIARHDIGTVFRLPRGRPFGSRPVIFPLLTSDRLAGRTTLGPRRSWKPDRPPAPRSVGPSVLSDLQFLAFSDKPRSPPGGPAATAQPKLGGVLSAHAGKNRSPKKHQFRYTRPVSPRRSAARTEKMSAARAPNKVDESRPPLISDDPLVGAGRSIDGGNAERCRGLGRVLIIDDPPRTPGVLLETGDRRALAAHLRNPSERKLPICRLAATPGESWFHSFERGPPASGELARADGSSPARHGRAPLVLSFFFPRRLLRTEIGRRRGSAAGVQLTRRQRPAIDPRLLLPVAAPFRYEAAPPFSPLGPLPCHMASNEDSPRYSNFFGLTTRANHPGAWGTQIRQQLEKPLFLASQLGFHHDGDTRPIGQPGRARPGRTRPTLAGSECPRS